jgi:hypothetical protein
LKTIAEFVNLTILTGGRRALRFGLWTLFVKIAVCWKQAETRRAVPCRAGQAAGSAFNSKPKIQNHIFRFAFFVLHFPRPPLALLSAVESRLPIFLLLNTGSKKCLSFSVV